MGLDAVQGWLRDQDGTISRSQALAAGCTDADIERLLRRREWAAVHRGVYVDHTGPPSWTQRAWAAVHVHAPAALGGASALRAFGLGRMADTAETAIEVVVARGRRVRDPDGVTTSTVRDFDRVVLRNLGPPRVRLEHAVLTVAARGSGEDDAVAVLADACQSRRTTPERLVSELAARVRLPRRSLLGEVLADVAEGTHSALERRYLRDVERAHGLPVGVRQRRVEERAGQCGRVVFRDVDYSAARTVVELDGRLGHEWDADRAADLARDARAAAAGTLTLRAGWSQVLDPCTLAAAVGDVLAARGWAGRPTPCGGDCSAWRRAA